MGRLARYAGLRFFRFFARPLGGNTVQPSPLSLRLLDEADIAAHWTDAELGLRPDGIAAAYRRGDVCVAAFDGSALAGYCWLAFQPLHHLDGVYVGFGPEVVWTYKSFVRPSYRGRGIAAALYHYGDETSCERGRGISLICVESHNTPSVTAAMRARYTDAGRATYLRRGSLFMDWYSRSLVQRYRVSFFVPR